MNNISDVRAREILDSRGNPTLEVDVELTDGTLGRAGVPSGASAGTFEALELRDGDPNRFRGLGVTEAIGNIDGPIKSALIGNTPDNQSYIDKILIELDSTANKSILGANAMVGTSLAVAKAAAKTNGLHLYEYLAPKNKINMPVPMFNIINGGRHADGSTDFQEFMIVPAGFNSFSEALRAGVEIYHSLGDILRSRKVLTSLGDEGGFAPPLKSNQEAIELTLTAIERAGYIPGEHCFIAIDVAASELILDDGRYSLLREGQIIAAEKLMDRYEEWVLKYPIVSIEDGLGEEDWKNWNKLTKQIGSLVQLVGDDLFVTNPERLQRGIDNDSANAILIKINQIGTISETLTAINLAQDTNWGTIISHRSGETTDDSISDIAVATGAGQIKAGAPARGERTAKYNRLLRIEEQLGHDAIFPGLSTYKTIKDNIKLSSI